MITVGDDAKPRGSNVATSLFFCSNVVRHLLAEWRFSSVLAASKKALRLWRVAEMFDNGKVILVWHFDKISDSIVKLITSKLQRPGYL